MNVQNIQILFLLFDSIIMLAPWRIVTKTADRIGYAASRNLARGLVVTAIVCVVFHAFPPGSIIGAILPAGDLGGTLVPHLRIGSRLAGTMLLGFCFGIWVWCGLWLWNRSLRALMPLWNGFA